MRILTKIPVFFFLESSSLQSVRIMLEGVECELVFIERGKQNMVFLLHVKMKVTFFLLFQAINTELISDCDCILVVFSVANLASLREAKMILISLSLSRELNSKAVILVGNKTDLVRAREVLIDGNIFVPKIVNSTHSLSQIHAHWPLLMTVNMLKLAQL